MALEVELYEAGYARALVRVHDDHPGLRRGQHVVQMRAVVSTLPRPGGHQNRGDPLELVAAVAQEAPQVVSWEVEYANLDILGLEHEVPTSGVHLRVDR